MKHLLTRLQADHPAIHFQAAERFFWSPQEQTVYYDPKKASNEAQWALLHELSHALLGHKTYKTDFELLQLEVAAWDQAEKLSNTYHIKIDAEHVQDCLDTYRDWLHARSKCPSCGTHGVQTNPSTYQCLNCHTEWNVTTERFCRPYRKKVNRDTN